MTLLGVVVFSVAAHAQVPLQLVNSNTEVSSVGFRFEDTKTFEESRLHEQVATTAPGFFARGWRADVRNALAFLPAFSEVPEYPFDPLTLQRDVRRLINFYNRNGFLEPAIDYEVQLDTTDNTVDVRFLIDEGPPLILESLFFFGPDGLPIVDQLPPEVVGRWDRFVDQGALREGGRVSEVALGRLEDETLEFMQNLGFAFVRADVETEVDFEENTAEVVVLVDPGPRARFGEIRIEGLERVEEAVVLRELGFKTGDRYSYRELINGQRQVFALNLFQTALVDIAPDQEPSESVSIRVRVREGPPRLVTARTGYFSEGGLTGEASWTHRNFLGGARQFNTSALAQTGLGALHTPAGYASRRFRGAASLRQPHFPVRRMSLTAGPFVDYRDDFVERSLRFGGEATLLYERARVDNVSLVASYTSRNVIEVRDPSALGFFDPALDSDGMRRGFRLDITRLQLGGTLARLDNPLAPRRGFVVNPMAAITLPAPLSGVEYFRTRANLLGYHPLSEAVGVAARISVGRLLTYGATALDPDGLFERYRDDAFFSGGTGDVRGWSQGQIGPRVPNIRFEQEVVNGDTLLVPFLAPGLGYLPVGGRGRYSGSVQLNLPFPILGSSFGTFVFLDAGGLWDSPAYLSDEERAELDAELEAGISAGDGTLVQLTRLSQILDEERGTRVGTGAGLRFDTMIGPIEFALGYKINPTFLDRRSPEDVYETIISGSPDPLALDQIESSWWRRLSFHLTIGRGF